MGTEGIVHWTARPHLNRIINAYKKPVNIKIKTKMKIKFKIRTEPQAKINTKLHGEKEPDILGAQPLNVPQNKNLIRFIFKRKKKKKKKKKGGERKKKKKKKKKS